MGFLLFVMRKPCTFLGGIPLTNRLSKIPVCSDRFGVWLHRYYGYPLLWSFKGMSRQQIVLMLILRLVAYRYVDQK